MLIHGCKTGSKLGNIKVIKRKMLEQYVSKVFT